jgi:hypothetical protein
MYNAGPNIPFSLQVNNNGVWMTNPSISFATGNTVALPINAASITGLASDNYQLPVSYQWSVGVQRQITTKSVLSVSYVGNTSRHQSDQRNVNLPSETYLPQLIGGSKYQTAPGLPYPGFTTISLYQNEANTLYYGMQVDYNAQLGRDLNFRAMYTLSRAYDPSTGGNGGSDLQGVSNPYAGWKFDWGPSGYDRTHIFLANFIYDIPWLRHANSWLVRGVLGGWSVSGIVTVESGVPLNITTGGSQGGNGVGGTNRVDQVSGVSYPHTVEQWFTPSSFALPAVGAWGTLSYNALRGPGRDNWNLSLFKSFTFSESRGSRFELRLETFNTWNHTQFNAVDTTFADSRFGQVTSAFDPRIIQLGGKLYF